MKKVVIAISLLIPTIHHAMQPAVPQIISARSTRDKSAIPEWEKKFEEEHIIAPLIGKPEDYKKELEYTYLRAAFDRNFEKVLDCVKNGVNINVQSSNAKYSALHCALWLGEIHYPLLFFLLAQDSIDVNLKTNGRDGQTPFNFACAHLLHSYQNDEKEKCYRLFDRLFQRGAQITDEDMAKIHWDYLKKRGCEHPDLERLIKSKLTIQSP